MSSLFPVAPRADPVRDAEAEASKEHSTSTSQLALAPFPSFASFQPPAASFQPSEPGDVLAGINTLKDSQRSERVKQLLAAANNALSSSSDETDSSSHNEHSRKRRKQQHTNKERSKKKGKRHKSELSKVVAAEKSSKGLWQQFRLQDSSFGSSSSAVYLDSKPDFDNFQYGSVYAGKLPAYRRYVGDQSGTQNGLPGVQAMDRYYAARRQYLERSRKTRFLRLRSQQVPTATKLDHGPRLSMPMPAFIPVQSDIVQPGSTEGPLKPDATSPMPALRMMNLEELVMFRTRQFNQQIAETPRSLQLWLNYAQFQDETARFLNRKGQASAASEKKLMILEKALLHLPDCDELYLALLETVGTMVDAPDLMKRWRSVLLKRRGSLLLWCGYIEQIASNFSTFKVSSSRRAYEDAIANLLMHRTTRLKEGAPPEQIKLIEQAIIQLTTGLCSFNLRSGHTERAVAIVQACTEFHVHPPSLHEPTLSSLLRCFGAFWRSRAPRLGEKGAKGWGTWVRHTEGFYGGGNGAGGQEDGVSQQDREEEREEDKEEGGGWSGWVTAEVNTQGAEEGGGNEEGVAQGTPSADIHPADHSPKEGEELSDTENDEHEEAEGSAEPEVDEEELIRQLGLQFDSSWEALEAGIEAGLMQRWVREEGRRGAESWLPLREQDASDADLGNFDYERAVEMDDIRDCLFLLYTPSLPQQLVLQLLHTLGAPTILWAGAVSHDGEATNNRGGLLGVGAEALRTEDLLLHAASGGDVTAGLERVLHWVLPLQLRVWSCRVVSAPHRQLLQSVLLDLAEGPMADSPNVAEALMAVLAVRLTPPTGSGTQPDITTGPSCTPTSVQNGTFHEGLLHAKDTARRLLEKQRENLVLWDAFAQLEALSGQARSASRVYEMTLNGAGQGRPQPHLPVAALNYVDMLLDLDAALLPQALPQQQQQQVQPQPPSRAGKSGGGALTYVLQRAHHVLTWLLLGSGAYEPFKPPGQPLSQDQVVQVRRACQQRMPALLAANNGQLDRAAAATIAAVAMFEYVTGLLALGHAKGQGTGQTTGHGVGGVQGLKTASNVFMHVRAVAYGTSISTAHPPVPFSGHQGCSDGQLSIPGSLGGHSGHDVLSGGAAPSLPTLDRHLSVHHAMLSERHCRLLVRTCMVENTTAHTVSYTSVAPRDVRHALLAGLRAFPGNETLLHMLILFEVKNHAAAQLRQEFSVLCAEFRRVPALWMAAVLGEWALQHAQHVVVPGNRVVGLLEKALANDACKSVASLWAAYTKFLLCRQGDGAAARRVFLRGVHECVWDKGLWLLGLGSLAGGMSERERKELLGLMQDKELLVRTDVHEMVLFSDDTGAQGTDGSAV